MQFDLENFYLNDEKAVLPDKCEYITEIYQSYNDGLTVYEKFKHPFDYENLVTQKNSSSQNEFIMEDFSSYLE